MFQLPRYVIKAGRVIVEQGEIRETPSGETLHVAPSYDPADVPHIAEWFEQNLSDFDPASNSHGWQWTAGCGADASPYFRIFNPVTQGRKFDPDGEYVRHWCPELAKLPNEFIHLPFDAPAGVLAQAGVTLGQTYPRPIVDHTMARNAALAGYEQVRSARR